MRFLSGGIGVSIAIVIALVGVGSRGEEPAEAGAPPPEFETMHADGAAVEAALLDATRAYLYGDLVAAREAMDRIAAGCRNPLTGDVPTWPPKAAQFARAFHMGLNASRELAARRELEGSQERFFWIQRACRNCHVVSRENGLPAPEDTSGGVSPRESPR
jgi:hypothetical protein